MSVRNVSEQGCFSRSCFRHIFKPIFSTFDCNELSKVDVNDLSAERVAVFAGIFSYSSRTGKTEDKVVPAVSVETAFEVINCRC